MSFDTFLKILNVATAILRNHLDGKAAQVLDGWNELERLISAGRQSVANQAGKPVDPKLVEP